MSEEFDPKTVDQDIETDEVNDWGDDDYTPEYVNVTGEDGVTYSFEKLDAVENEAGRFLALLPVYENDEDALSGDGELIIVQVIEDGDGFMLAPVEDDELYDELATAFEERLSDFYDIQSED